MRSVALTWKSNRQSYYIFFNKDFDKYVGIDRRCYILLSQGHLTSLCDSLRRWRLRARTPHSARDVLPHGYLLDDLDGVVAVVLCSSAEERGSTFYPCLYFCSLLDSFSCCENALVFALLVCNLLLKTLTVYSMIPWPHKRPTWNCAYY